MNEIKRNSFKITSKNYQRPGRQAGRQCCERPSHVISRLPRNTPERGWPQTPSIPCAQCESCDPTAGQWSCVSLSTMTTHTQACPETPPMQTQHRGRRSSATPRLPRADLSSGWPWLCGYWSVLVWSVLCNTSGSINKAAGDSQHLWLLEETQKLRNKTSIAVESNSLNQYSTKNHSPAAGI